MGKKKVSGKTHTKKQLDDYANQHNPNNKAYKANKANQQKQKRQNHKTPELWELERKFGYFTGESFGWCDD